MKRVIGVISVVAVLFIGSVVVLANPYAAPEPDSVVKVIETTIK